MLVILPSVQSTYIGILHCIAPQKVIIILLFCTLRRFGLFLTNRLLCRHLFSQSHTCVYQLQYMALYQYFTFKTYVAARGLRLLTAAAGPSSRLVAAALGSLAPRHVPVRDLILTALSKKILDFAETQFGK